MRDQLKVFIATSSFSSLTENIKNFAKKKKNLI